MKVSTKPKTIKGDYHASPGVSQSLLKLYKQDPRRYYGRVNGLDPPEESEAFDFGKDFESYVFYNHINFSLVPAEVLSKSGAKAGGQYREWKAQQDPQERDYKAADYDARVEQLDAMRQRLQEHPEASPLVQQAEYQQIGLTWLDSASELLCKCEIDLVTRDKDDKECLADLKTAADSSSSAFRNSAARFGYATQAAFYRRAWRLKAGQNLPFYFIVCSKSPSYQCRVFELSARWLDAAEAEIDQQLESLAKCNRIDDFRHDDEKRILLIDEPRWSQNEREYLS